MGQRWPWRRSSPQAGSARPGWPSNGPTAICTNSPTASSSPTSGGSPVGEPMSPAAIIRDFLEALGVESARTPVTFEAQLALYRSHLAGKKMLIVLDNIRDAASVAPLLPGSPSCTVLVTSRDLLPGLTTAHGARLLRIGVLSDQDARAVLLARVGEQRVNAEPEAVIKLLACCDGFPLALAIVASRAQTEPTFPLATLAESLGDDATRLGELDEDDPATSLPAVLSWSYKALTVAQSRAFVLLGGVGPTIGLAAAASLLALPADRTKRLLRGLERVSMLRQETPGRYNMHDLVRLYAIDTARRGPPTERDTATRRLVDHYLHSACADDRLLYPDRIRIDLGEPVPGCAPEAPADQAEALTWFGTEHRCYSAVHRLAEDLGWHRTVWQLGWATANFRWRFGHLDEKLASARAGLAAADRLGEPAVLAAAHRLLGMALVRVHLFEEALDHLQQTLRHGEQTDDRRAMANAHASLATAFGRADNHIDALTHASRALTLFREVDTSATAEAEALNMVGWHAAWTGDHELARTSYERALALHRAHDYPAAEANTLDSLGFTFHRMGAYDLIPASRGSASIAVRPASPLSRAFLAEGRSCDGLPTQRHAVGGPNRPVMMMPPIAPITVARSLTAAFSVVLASVRYVM